MVVVVVFERRWRVCVVEGVDRFTYGFETLVTDFIALEPQLLD